MQDTRAGIAFDGFKKASLAWAALDGKALGTARTDWTFVRDTAMWYVAKKATDHRFDGQGQFDQGKIATWDAIEGKELVP
jgi:hypothetical protein